jgi:hypothetical protein
VLTALPEIGNVIWDVWATSEEDHVLEEMSGVPGLTPTFNVVLDSFERSVTV